MISLHVEPRIVKTPEEFIHNSFPGYSIALDGYVKGKPSYVLKSEGPKANFNHHEDVDRLGTRSTCAQVHMAIKQGLFYAFSHDNEPYANIYVNDCDQDVCLSTWLLFNHERIDGQKSEPLITRLVGVTDFLDATAGAYPLSPSMSVRKELAWIYEPYIQSRVDGRIGEMKQPEMRNVIETVCNRITQYTLGKGGKVALDTTFEVIGGGKKWSLIKEIGYEARAELFLREIKTFVSVRESNGRFDYSIGKTSPYVNSNLEHIYHILNSHEKLVDETNKWGGSDLIGGSPRQSGSSLSPEKLEQILNDYFEEQIIPGRKIK